MTARGTAMVLAAMLAAAGPARGDDLVCLTPAGGSCERAPVGFTPAYPDPATMPNYVAFTATLPGLGYLTDHDGDGAVADERCDPGMVSGLGVMVGAMKALVAGKALCNVFPENVDTGCFVALAVVAEAAEAASTVAEQCKYQDGQVGDAETEAVYENVKIVAALQLERSLDGCTALGTLVLPKALGGRAEEVQALVERRVAQVASTGLWPEGVARAQEELALGAARLAAAEYRDAFNQFCRAYKQLQLAHR